MGFFSSIVKFVKDVVREVMAAIAQIFVGIFGSPEVAALAMFVVGFMIMGPASFTSLVSNPLFFLSQSLSLTMFIGTSLVLGGVIGLISAICPSLGIALGFVFGLISFIAFGLQVLTFVWPSLAQYVTVQAVLGIGLYEGSLISQWFALANAVGTIAVLVGLADGVSPTGELNSPYTRAYVDGFFAVPEVIAVVGDAVLGAAFSALDWLLLAGAGVGLYMLLKDDKARVAVDVAQQPGIGGPIDAFA